MKLKESSHPKRLLITPKPKPDESFMGYILRLTERNGYEMPLWILKLARIEIVSWHQLRSVPFNEKLNLVPLARLTGVNESELRQLTYPPVDEPDALIYRRLFFGLPIFHYAIRITNSKVCPHCLTEEAYYRRVWDLVPATVCLSHNCLLLDTCPQCKKQITIRRARVSVCACKFDLRGASTRSVSDTELAVARQIYRLCGLSYVGKAKRHTTENNPLLSLDLEHFTSALFFIAGQYEGIVDTKGKYLIPTRRNAELHTLLNKAFALFQNWPDDYYQFIKSLQSKSNKAIFMTGFNKDFGNFYSGLYKNLTSERFNFMRVAFEQYIAEHWVGGYARTINRHKGTKRQDLKYIGFTEATRRLQVRDTWVNRFIDNGRLKAIVRKQRKKRIILIEAESIKELKRELKQSLAMKETAKILNIWWESVKGLVREGCLEALHGPEVDGRGVWSFSHSSINEFLDKLAARIKVIPAEEPTINLPEAVTLLSPLNVTIVRFVRFILDGEINPCEQSRGKGLSGFLFPKRQILDYLSTLLQKKREHRASLPQVAEILKVNNSVIHKLADRKIISTDKVIERGCLVRVVSAEAIEQFQANYVLLPEITLDTGLSPTYLIRLLNKKGIKAVSGPTIDGGRQYVFKRTDLKPLNFVALAEESPSKTALTRLLDKREAASIIGTDVKTVDKLVENGLLKPYIMDRRNGLISDEYRFTVHAVKKYKDRFMGHGDLVSATVASKMLGEHPHVTYLNWIKTGHLNPIEVKGEKSYYFLRKNVETVLAFKNATISSVEAAKILGVRTRDIWKWTKAGKLKAAAGPEIDGFGEYRYWRREIEGRAINEPERKVA